MQTSSTTCGSTTTVRTKADPSGVTFLNGSASTAFVVRYTSKDYNRGQPAFLTNGDTRWSSRGVSKDTLFASEADALEAVHSYMGPSWIASVRKLNQMEILSVTVTQRVDVSFQVIEKPKYTFVELPIQRSSVVKGLRYDSNAKVLEVGLAHGSDVVWYRYENVPSELVGRFAFAESMGRFYGENVRNKFRMLFCSK